MSPSWVSDPSGTSEIGQDVFILGADSPSGVSTTFRVARSESGSPHGRQVVLTKMIVPSSGYLIQAILYPSHFTFAVAQGVWCDVYTSGTVP